MWSASGEVSPRQVHGEIRANFWPPFRALVIARVDQEYRNPRAELDPDTGAVVGDSRINAHGTGAREGARHSSRRERTDLSGAFQVSRVNAVRIYCSGSTLSLLARKLISFRGFRADECIPFAELKLRRATRMKSFRRERMRKTASIKRYGDMGNLIVQRRYFQTDLLLPRLACTQSRTDIY